MKKRILNTALVATMLISGLALNAQEEKEPRGVITKEHTVDQFDAVRAEGSVEMTISQGEVQQVLVETDADQQDKVGLKVSGGTLIVSAGKVKNPSDLKVHVTAKELRAVSASGATEVSSKSVLSAEKMTINASGASEMELELNVKSLDVKVSGAATLELSGKAGLVDGNVSGAGDLKGGKLETVNATIKTSGAGSAVLSVEEEVNADISGVSDLKFVKEPKVKNIRNKGMAEVKNTSARIGGVKVVTSDNGDSTQVRIGEMDIQVIDGDTTLIKIGGTRMEVDEDGNMEFVREKKERFDGHWGGFELGINGFVNSDNEMDLPPEYDFMDLTLEKSINVHLNFFEQNFNLARNHLGLVTGLGLEYCNYRLGDQVELTGGRDVISVIPPEEMEDRDYTKSKLVVNYLTVPAILEYQTNRHHKTNSFHISAGIVGGLRIGSHTKMVWHEGGKQKNKVRDDFHVNPLKAEAMARIGWGKINLYANYSLIPLFRDDEGPEVYPFSIGLTLASW